MNNAKYLKDRRERLKSEGLCITCGSLPSSETNTQCGGCYAKARESAKKWKAEHPTRIKELKKRYNRRKNLLRKQDRIDAIIKLGGRCECCGEDEVRFLQIDHPDNDGNIHREEVKGGSYGVVKDILKESKKYRTRVLCANCHFAITYYGECPHDSAKVHLSASSKSSYENHRRDASPT